MRQWEILIMPLSGNRLELLQYSKIVDAREWHNDEIAQWSSLMAFGGPIIIKH